MVGQDKGDIGQILAVDPDRTGLEVAVQHLLHTVLQHPIGFEQEGQSAVLATGALFGEVNCLIQVDLRVASQLPGEIEQPLEALLIAGAVDQGADGDGAHIDHRVQMGAEQGRVGHIDGVKGLSGGLHAHFGADYLLAVVQQGEKQEDRFDNALDGKVLAIGAGLVVPSIAAQDVDPQVAGVALGQLRDVGGDFSMSCVGLAFSEQGIQQFFHVIPFLSAWDADLRRIRRRISSLLLYAPVPNRGAADA